MQAKQVWMFVPVGLLLLSATIGAITVFVAVRDPGFGVEQDYYRKGLEHDRAMAQAAANQALGWSLRLEASVVVGARLSPATVTLLDADGAPVAGARVTVEAFPLARSADPARAEMAETAPGSYRAELPLRRTGKWEFRFRAEAGGQVYTSTLQTFLAAREPGQG
ncbi:MAG: FixH family protein [Planctomycetes bacterium]|nr:FixH family protein [Planctomycetota bacterium]